MAKTTLGKVPAIGALALTISSAAFADETTLPGYTEGSQVIKVEQTQGRIDEISGIVYSQIKQPLKYTQLQMTILTPRNDNLKPAVVYFPGGGFITAAHEKYLQMRTALAEAGYVVAAAEYRVVPDQFPGLVQDAKSAIRYLRAHAEDYGIDPDRIGVIGDSAGGYVAQMAGTTNGETEFDAGDFLDYSSDVQAAVTIYGISNLLNIGEGFPEEIQDVHHSPSVTEALLLHGPAFRTFAGAAITSDPEKALQASPMGHIDEKEPPFLIMHGSADTLVSPEQSSQLYRALQEKGNDSTYILVEGAEHGDITWYQPTVINTVVGWFKKHLGEPTAGTGKADDMDTRL